MSKKRRTIGLLVSGIMDQFTESLCRGAIEGCADRDLDLVVLPGKYIDRDLSGQPEIMYEYQFNTIFDYAASKSFDGLIVSAGNIGCLSSDDRVLALLENYGDTPIMTVASKLPGYVSVNYDNESGVREGLLYLINVLGCRRIAMLAGPEGNMDAFERKQTYLSVLKEHGIEVTEQMIVYGDLSHENEDICNQLLDNNPDAEAIFCVNDDSAMGLYEVMRKRGLTPGKDIKIFGYDNTVAGSKAQPSLSTVGSDAVVLGRESVDTICRLMDGEKVSSKVLPAKFILRNSFGDITDINEAGGSRFAEGKADTIFDEIFYRYIDAGIKDTEDVRASFGRLIGRMYALKDMLGDAEAEDALMRAADDFIATNALEYADMEDLIFHLEKLYVMLRVKRGNLDEKYRLRKLFNVFYKKIISDMDHRAGRVRRSRENDMYSMKLFVRDSMKFRRGNDSAYADLLNAMSYMGARNIYLYTFEEPVAHLYRESFIMPENICIKAYLSNGEVKSVPVNRQKLKTLDIFSNKYTTDERSALVLMPLFYDEMQYGLLLMDLTDEMYSSGEFFTNQIGSAVHMIDILRSNEIIQQKLEDTLVSLREKNISLDHISKQDVLTGINNRRGFKEAAEALIKEDASEGTDTLVAYVDMNNLKIINDRYGHEEGDYSLKLISTILSEVAGDKGVVGRIGGDEYSFALKMDRGMAAEGVERRIHSLFSAHNKSSDKPYNVTVSIGFYLISYKEDTELDEALSLADEKLYIAKQNKVRTVEKK